MTIDDILAEIKHRSLDARFADFQRLDEQVLIEHVNAHRGERAGFSGFS
jgi:hypothetical protein